jgi:hypothetical protein
MGEGTPTMDTFDEDEEERGGGGSPCGECGLAIHIYFVTTNNVSDPPSAVCRTAGVELKKLTCSTTYGTSV